MTKFVDVEWKNWTSDDLHSLKWRILNEKQFISSSKAILGKQDNQTRLQPSIGVLLNGSAAFHVPVKANLRSFTLCFWISTNKTTSKLAKIAIMRGSEMSVDVFFHRSVWKHICQSFENGVSLIYLDGAANKTAYGYWKLRHAVASVSITSSEVIYFKLSSINVWDQALDKHAILYMSYQCGKDRGNMVIWEEFIKNISIVTTSNSTVNYNERTSCKGRQGNVLSVVSSKTTTSSEKAVIMSPRYHLPLGWVKSPAKCLRFQYRLWGPGAKVLKLYQILDDKMFPRRQLWVDEDSSSSDWKEGQVTLSAVTGYQIAIEGEVSNAPALISIGALYTTDGYCAILPITSSKACNEIFTNSSGLIMSPYYPSYYNNNATCNSTIKARQGHVIRLDIDEFELEMSTRCENDYVEVYDGETRIGRYCGVRYPPIIQSTTNQFSVLFHSNARITRAGFMARYRILKDADTNKECLQDCPAECECRMLSDGRVVVSSRSLNSVPGQLPLKTSVVLFSGNKIFRIDSKTFKNLQYLSLIDLSYNRLIHMDQKSFSTLPSLHTLRLNMNFMREIESETWDAVETLQNLDIGDNLISSIGSQIFSNLRDLKVLSLRDNLIKFLDVNTFQNNTQLMSLYLHSNAIQKIPDGLFRNQRKLRALQLHDNKLETLTKSSFRGLSMLEKLTLNNNTIKESKVPRDVFSELKNLKYLTMDSFMLCCYAKKTISNLKTCESQANSFSSCEDMLKRTAIRVGIWIQGLFASFGNFAVILWWTIQDRKKSPNVSKKSSVQSLLLRNLALADFLMGIYLLFIAIQDILWKGEYVDHDVEWRTGISCQIAGAISTLSSEVSVMMLVLLTGDRFSTIVFDFRGKRLSLKTAYCVCSVLWIIGIAIAFTPLFATSYFIDETTGFSFYGRSTVCLAFQLSSEQPAGWEYSVAVFMAFNGAAFLFIFVAYVAIFIKVKKSAKKVQSTREPSSLGTRIMFIVLTDFFCWMPVIVLGLLSLAGHFKDPTGQVYAVMAVFILPVNSSINPILYTFATPQAKKAFMQWSSAISGAISELRAERRSLNESGEQTEDKNKSQTDVQLVQIQRSYHNQ